MSRHVYRGDEWDVAFGVDGVTSAYVEVWRHPIENQDTWSVMANNTGITACDEELSKYLLKEVEELRRVFEISRQYGVSHPNLSRADVEPLVKAAGFHDLAVEIERAYD